MPEYFVMTAPFEPAFCAIHDHNERLENFPAPAIGESLGAAWPDGLEYRMDKDSKGIEVPDLVPNSLGYTMMSERLKTLIAGRSTAKIEWLRFTLLNHKKRVASDRMWVANVLTIVDCVDREKTVGEPYPARPEWYISTKRLSIRPEKVDAALDLFRLGEMPRRIIVRDDLKAAIEREQATGAAFYPMGADVRLR
ncbi:MAG TPA: DUF1629 domain-containing protein [Gemmatimonadaceae bacterium]|nr:DUF1629 domain-containing protein [Gemmatimonadaceae bacterium]